MKPCWRKAAYEYDDKWISAYAFVITFMTVILPLLFRVLSGSESWYRDSHAVRGG